MTVPVVFLGPSLPLAQARRRLDAVYLPPVRQGRVWQVVIACRPAAIGIIDGAFEHVPAVWHKEILWALAEGVTVGGAASLGALRAVELAAFGMVGIGRIFEAYRCGRLDPYTDPFEDDDEVAVVHGPADSGYLASEAMVNIRITLARAAADSVIDAPARDALVSRAKATFYKDRSWDQLLRDGETLLAPATAARLRAWLADGRIDQKRADALALLDWLGERREAAPCDRRFRFERTTLWEHGQAQLLAAHAPAPASTADDTVDDTAAVDLDALKRLDPEAALARIVAAWRRALVPRG